MTRKKASSDYYRVLQLHEEAEPEVVQAAYRTLSKKYHPDTNKEKDADERMKQLNEAYAVLSDGERRADYDRTRRNGATSSTTATRTRSTTTSTSTTTTRKKPPRDWDKDDQYSSSTRDESAANPRVKNYKLKSFSAIGQEIEKVLLTYGPQDAFWLARYVSYSQRTGTVSRAEIQAAIRTDNGRVFKVAWTDNGKPVYDLTAV